MNGHSVALDTNVAIAVLNNADGAGEWIAQYSSIFIPVTVIGELRYGAMNSRNMQQNFRRIDAMISACHILEIKVETATEYAQVRVSLKKAGFPIPENDVWIAATCVQNDLPLATEDDHFSRVAGLQIISRG